MRAEAFLPEAGENWSRLDVEEHTWPHLGGDGGLMAEYEAQNGDVHTVLIFEEENSHLAGSRAREFVCAGWPVAIHNGRFALASGTGTDQVELTPERPPRLDKTPIPETKSESAALLRRSPYLSDETFESNKISECDSS